MTAGKKLTKKNGEDPILIALGILEYKILSKLENIVNRMDVIEARISTIDVNIGAVNKRLESVENRLAKIENRTANIEVQLDGHAEKLATRI